MRAATKCCFLAVCVALMLSACGGSSTGASTARTDQPRHNLVSIFENDQLVYDSWVKNHTTAEAFATFKQLGAQEVRMMVPWVYLAPDPTSFTTPKVNLTDPNSYAESYWEYLDNIVVQAKAAGIRLLLTVCSPAPYWALGKDPETPLSQGSWKPDAADFGDLVKALGKRYSGTYTPPGASAPLPRVNMWSIWNEPNAIYLTPNAVGPGQTPYAPRLYRALVDAAWTGLVSTGHTPRTDTILIGETAPRGLTGKHLPGDAGGLLPLIFIRDLYCVSTTLTPLTGASATTVGCPASGSRTAFRAQNPGLFEASGWADHPYSDDSAPTVKAPPSVGAEYTDFASLSNLESTLTGVFKTYGSSVKLPIYNDEYGYKTDPPTSLGIPDKTAAEYMNEAEYLSWLNPRIRSFDQYLLIDPPPSGGEFDTGLESPTRAPGVGTPKPDVYDAYLMPLYLPQTSTSHGKPLTVWGCARPVNDESVTSPKVLIQFAAGASGIYRTVKTVTLDPARAGCYFTTSLSAQHSGSVRLEYMAAGKTFHSRSQSIMVG